MKSRSVETITTTEEMVRFGIFEGDLQISDAGAELLRIEKAQHETERKAHARTRQELAEAHWRCFFCDEVFTTRDQAAEHFGTEVGCDYPITACQIKAHEGHLVHYIRKLEEELGVWSSESHDMQKAVMALESSIAEQVQRAEEQGYARGVADMTKQGFCAEPEKHL